jgi:hypothetical protein
MNIEMKHTKACASELIDTAWAGDIALSVGNADGELGRVYASNRGDVLSGTTLFDMMSVTKIIAVAPLFHIAMDEGKISPDDTLGKYFPDAPEDKRDIPLWMMLTHISGIRKNTPEDFVGPDKRSEYVAWALSRPLLFTPGERYEYSCGNFALLGFISNLIYVAYPSGVMAYEISPLSYRVVQTMLFHSCMMIACLSVLIHDRYPLHVQNCYRDLCVLGGMTVWATVGNASYSGQLGDYNHSFNWFFVRRDPLGILPETVAPYLAPIVNIIAFFGIEMIIYLIFHLIRRKKAVK